MTVLPRFIAFDGIDGSSKHAVLELVAEMLRGRGVRVCVPRAIEFPDTHANRLIDLLTRDPRNIALSPYAEFNLGCARQAQLVAEVIAPALARGETVLLADSFLAEVVLAQHGRGLDRDACEITARLASGGREPELTVVFDVHPATALVRARIDRIRAHTLPFRERLDASGYALLDRLRNGYLHVAHERGHPVVYGERVTTRGLAERVVRILEGERVEHSPSDAQPHWHVPEGWTLGQAMASMPTAMALYFSSGLAVGQVLRCEAISEEPQLAAWAIDPLDPLREQAAAVDPQYALRGLMCRPLEPNDLREQYIQRAPDAVATSLRFVGGERADHLREELAAVVPGAVLSSLSGRDDEFAAVLRRRLWDHAAPDQQAASIMHCAGDEWSRHREHLLRTAGTIGIESLRGAAPEFADPWLFHYADTAPAAVLRALTGRTDGRAHELRSHLIGTGPEVVDSIRGQTDPDAWLLRERCVDQWPAAVVRSLISVPDSPRRRTLLERCRQVGHTDVHVLRRLCELDEYKRLPAWARQRDSLDDDT